MKNRGKNRGDVSEVAGLVSFLFYNGKGLVCCKAYAKVSRQDESQVEEMARNVSLMSDRAEGDEIQGEGE